MKTPPVASRESFLETLLNFLWQEWTALGIPGHDRKPLQHVVDPEALLLLTCSIGRYDPRLFDEVMGWLLKNGRFINVQRLRTILNKEPYTGGPVLAAIADWLGQQGAPTKWKQVANPPEPTTQRANQVQTGAPNARPVSKRAQEDRAHYQRSTVNCPLFTLPDGRPIPVLHTPDPTFEKHGFLRERFELHENAHSFPADKVAARLLRLRALFGINARCDILNFLALNKTGHPRAIARECYFSQKTVYDALADLECAGVVASVKAPRERTYRLTAEGVQIVGGGEPATEWINWPLLLVTVEAIWTGVENSTGETIVAETAIGQLADRLHESPWMAQPFHQAGDVISAIMATTTTLTNVTR